MTKGEAAGMMSANFNISSHLAALPIETGNAKYICKLRPSVNTIMNIISNLERLPPLTLYPTKEGITENSQPRNV